MKTLSVRQPWANLICLGIKDIENRSRRTNYRGEILIHAPAKFDKLGIYGLATEAQAIYLSRWYELNKKKGYDVDRLYSMKGRKIHSAIIGNIEIIDCINDSKSIWAEPGQWYWILSNPVLFDKPILDVKGKLGLWNYDYE